MVMEDHLLAFALSTSLQQEPTTYQQAILGPNANEWKESMMDEIQSIESNETWELCKLPTGQKAIGLKWVYKIKYAVDGSLARYKSRLVVKGYRQRAGFDYEETYSPVASITGVRILLTIAAAHNLNLEQFDVKTAFLHGDIDVDNIYVTQPEGYIRKGQEDCVYRLLKSLYGLKQANRIWNKTMHKILIKCGLKQSIKEPCLYYRNEADEITILALFVDDMMIATNKPGKYLGLIKGHKIDIKQVEADHFLAIQVKRDQIQRKISINQISYVEKALEKFSMLGSKPCPTPMTPGVLTSEMSPTQQDDIKQMANIPYREAVGTLMYLAVVSRPDIMKAVSTVSRFLNNPGSQHWIAVKRIFRYLKGTMHFQLELGGEEGKALELSVYCDASWADAADQRRSTSGYLIYLGTGCISWKTRVQPTVSLSTTEAEYKSLCEGVCELLYLMPICKELGINCSQPITLYEDNAGCKAIAENGIKNARSKHIDVKYYFLQEVIASKVCKVVYCPTEMMIADIMTKGLGRVAHQRLVKKLMLKGSETQEHQSKHFSGSVEIEEESTMPERKRKQDSLWEDKVLARCEGLNGDRRHSKPKWQGLPRC